MSMEAFQVEKSEASWPRQHEVAKGKGTQRPVASRFVRDFVELDAPYEVAKRAFFDGGTSWLSPIATDAEMDGERLRVRVGVGDSETVLSKEVQLVVSEPRERKGELVVSLRWEAAQGAWLFPRLDADLGLAPIGDGVCQLWLDGTYKPPLGRTGQILDQTLLHRVAESTIRCFLLGIANTLERLAKEGS